VFLHAADASHGDAGVFMRGDVVVAISSSGETEEVVRLLPIVKRFHLPLIAMTGKGNSALGRAADVVLDVSVAEEACPLGLAPTASTTATLAMGDALAVALLERKRFGASDFAVFHPAGSLGRRLRQVGELMHTGEAIPLVEHAAPLRDVMVEISRKRLGVTGVTGPRGQLVGAITDGDLRRAWEREIDLRTAKAADIMSEHPKTISATALAEEAVELMERHSITSLFILEGKGKKPAGVLHLHDLLKAGVV
ncbi:MAG TPA: KpsF/GutQ family sugar-phosphate isomerase, partial [Terriglobales bacterium]|nr:KpsF/GutQ family sugar-phosphate isomerase [Terriglobales bacterium]